MASLPVVRGSQCSRYEKVAKVLGCFFTLNAKIVLKVTTCKSVYPYILRLLVVAVFRDSLTRYVGQSKVANVSC